MVLNLVTASVTIHGFIPKNGGNDEEKIHKHDHACGIPDDHFLRRQ